MKESMIIQQDEKKNLMNSWTHERSNMLSDMKNIIVSKDSELLSLKGERDSAQDRAIKMEVCWNILHVISFVMNDNV